MWPEYTATCIYTIIIILLSSARARVCVYGGGTTARRKSYFPRQFQRYRRRILAGPILPSRPTARARCPVADRPVSARSRPDSARHVFYRRRRYTSLAPRGVSLFVKLQFIITSFRLPSFPARWVTYNGNPSLPGPPPPTTVRARNSFRRYRTRRSACVPYSPPLSSFIPTTGRPTVVTTAIRHRLHETVRSLYASSFHRVYYGRFRGTTRNRTTPRVVHVRLRWIPG